MVSQKYCYRTLTAQKIETLVFSDSFMRFGVAALALLFVGIVQRANSIAQRSSRLALSQACGYTGSGTGFTWEMTEESGVTLTITGSGSDGGG